ncbi:hypothetical protein LBW62_24740 [Ralstonia solanacearum]|uniref:hypothetical protein n=1 Tax=Ralstonia solanacearum TaxID=305 RepID=UPI00070D34C2|nr:hypothetical protein [Ralstonia solanacearum]MBB6591730.1 hypothetical protein [Ralstonia solanacearum]MBB6595953.1 hypothetical protein [Ralstonia solanacearum]MDB0544361.1 hypothetical protein [Ralstonia solanacearum]MDB0554288.1 hypothetical protein [Ralstonia solanacearum]MDB0559370.1 hypothetical protein [Ralstonia solanacearum]
MSQAQVDATVLLCRLLERDKPEINGQALFDGDPQAAAHLLRERLLVVGRPLDWVTCPDCRVEIARVVRDVSADRIALRCPECEDIDASRRLRETYTAVPARAVAALLSGLGMTAGGMKVIEPDRVWRLGTTESTRGKPLTWYFARQLGRREIGARLREQIQLERTAGSSVVLTTSELPLPIGSPMVGFDVRTLRTVARIGQSRFEFFADRQVAPGVQQVGEAEPRLAVQTTLRYVRSLGRAFIEGQEHPLEPRQQAMLLALINDLDHEMGKDALKTACGSQAQRFSPSKEFDRNPVAYKTFIRYLRDDERYALIIPDEDRDWLG